MKVKVSDIQHFCLHDGPGIRTTIFLKGCNLKCPWCANPECISFKFQDYEDDDSKGTFGYYISLDELEHEILKDKAFYATNNGGVTFSGGEPLLQIEKLEPLLKSLKEKKINICIETALMCEKKLLDIALNYADEFLVDIKILDNELANSILNGDINTYFDNLDLLFSKNENVTFRIPLVSNYTTTENNIKLISKLLKKYKSKKVEIFKIHNLAKKKYDALNMDMMDFPQISDEELDVIYNKLSNIVENIEIISI